MSINSIRTALTNRFNSIPGIIPTIALSAITAGTPGVFTTAIPHGLISGIYVVMSAIIGNTPIVDDNYLVTVIDDYNFSLQDSATVAPISVTIAGIGGSVSANLTSWPNAIFQTVIGVPYVKIDWIDAAASEPTQGGGFKIEQGYMQATLVYPSGIGSGALVARAELIRSYFAKGLVLIQDGLRVTIPQEPQLGSDTQSHEQYTKVIRIYHSTQVFS